MEKTNEVIAVKDDLPGVIPLTHPSLWRELSYKNYTAIRTARSRGTFCLRVINRGGTLCVLKSDLLKFLQDGEPQTGSVPPLKKKLVVKTGRPTKLETLEAQRRGITVRELRAQASIKLSEGGQS